MHIVKTLQDVVTFCLEMLLKSQFLLPYMLYVEKWDRSKLQTDRYSTCVKRSPAVVDKRLTDDWHRHPGKILRPGQCGIA
jgi:hypothetical protein